MIIRLPQRVLSVPRVITVAGSIPGWHRYTRQEKRAVLVPNMRSAVNAGNWNPRLPRLRQVHGY